MSLKTNENLGVSFSLPDSLTVGQLDKYQQALQAALAQLNGNLTDARYYAILYGTAVESGLVSDWQCASQPDLSPASVDLADARVIYFVGAAIRDFVRSFTEIPPASPSPLPDAGAARERRRKNS